LIFDIKGANIKMIFRRQAGAPKLYAFSSINPFLKTIALGEEIGGII